MKRIIIVCALSLMMALTGCVETIVMDPHDEMPAVVYCVLTNKTDLQTLNLSAAELPSGVKPLLNAEEVVVLDSTLKCNALKRDSISLLS